jgi:hypothetical protein
MSRRLVKALRPDFGGVVSGIGKEFTTPSAPENCAALLLRNIDYVIQKCNPLDTGDDAGG